MTANPFFFWKSTKDSSRSPCESLTISSKLSEVAVLFPQQSDAFIRQDDENEKTPDDLFRHLRFFFIVGRILGIIPFSGVFSRSPSYQNLSFCLRRPAAIISFIVIAVLTLNLIFGIGHMMRYSSNKNALEIAQSFGATFQFFWSWLIYLNFILRGKKLFSIFHYWSKTTVFFGSPDRHLKRDSILITALIITSAFLENAVWHLQFVPAWDFISGTNVVHTTTNVSSLEVYYNRLHHPWAIFLSYNEFLGVIAFIQHKCIIYAWNYLDIMIAIFSRAMYYRFKMLYKLSMETLVKPLMNGQNDGFRGKKWAQIAYDHKQLCILLDQMESFFSPLIFGSYAVNIFYICLQMLDGLTMDISKTSLLHSIYAPWSFLHIILRMYILSICAARVNSYAHKIRDVIQECPVDQYTDEIFRLDKKVTIGPLLGFSGLDCFLVTKPFLLQIISVVFTFEIVLLQGVPSG